MAHVPESQGVQGIFGAQPTLPISVADPDLEQRGGGGEGGGGLVGRS